MGLLDRTLKRAIARGFKGKLLKGTLHRGTATGLDAKGNIAITASLLFGVEGFVDEYSDFRRAQAGIPDTDLMVVLIAGLISPETSPKKDDRVMFSKGEHAGQWFQLRRDATDPAGAHWECQAYPCDAP